MSASMLIFLIGLVGVTNAIPSQRIRRDVDESSASTFLSRFGYAKPGQLGGGYGRTRDESFRNAINDYQESMGLAKTGNLDEATKKAMAAPRCGRPDLAHSGVLKWNKGTLKYHIENGGDDLTIQSTSGAMREAFGQWAAVVPLDFVEVSNRDEADLKISFQRRDHGDGDAFDGYGMVLAHAFFPTDGRIHFDDEERWTIKDTNVIKNMGGADLVAVATHEIGHAIGLDHIRGRGHEGDVMFPSWSAHFDAQGNYVSNRLTTNDIKAAQDIYGVRRGGVRCPNNFVYFGGSNKCYMFLRLQGDRSVDAANRMCGEISPGYTLSSVNSQVENDFLANASEDIFFLGYTATNNVDFHSFDGTPLTYTNWHQYEPNTNTGVENCLVLHGRAQGWHKEWNNVNCNLDFPYICAGRPL